MKSLFSIAALAVCCTVLFTQCTKDDMSKTFHAHFYTTSQTGKMFLYVDGVSKGELTSFTQVSPCGDVAGDVANKPLSLDLKSGDYDVVGKDEGGIIVSRSTVHVSKNHMSVCGGIGGSSLNSDGDCVSIGLIEQ